MSYRRIGEFGSDVYMYYDAVNWHIETAHHSYNVESLNAAENRLREIQSVGMCVPDFVFERISEEKIDFVEAQRKRDRKFLQDVRDEVFQSDAELLKALYDL